MATGNKKSFSLSLARSLSDLLLVLCVEVLFAVLPSRAGDLATTKSPGWPLRVRIAAQRAASVSLRFQGSAEAAAGGEAMAAEAAAADAGGTAADAETLDSAAAAEAEVAAAAG